MAHKRKPAMSRPVERTHEPDPLLKGLICAAVIVVIMVIGIMAGAALLGKGNGKPAASPPAKSSVTAPKPDGHGSVYPGSETTSSASVSAEGSEGNDASEQEHSVPTTPKAAPRTAGGDPLRLVQLLLIACVTIGVGYVCHLLLELRGLIYGLYKRVDGFSSHIQMTSPTPGVMASQQGSQATLQRIDQNLSDLMQMVVRSGGQKTAQTAAAKAYQASAPQQKPDPLETVQLTMTSDGLKSIRDAISRDKHDQVRTDVSDNDKNKALNLLELAEMVVEGRGGEVAEAKIVSLLLQPVVRLDGSSNESVRRLDKVCSEMQQEALRRLESAGWRQISPKPNDMFDQDRHIVDSKIPTSSHFQNLMIVNCVQPGLELKGVVKQAARVKVYVYQKSPSG